MKRIEATKAWGNIATNGKLRACAAVSREIQEAVYGGRCYRVRIIREEDYRELLRRARLNPYQPRFEGPVRGFRKPKKKGT